MAKQRVKRNKNRMKFKDWWYYYGQDFIKNLLPWIALAVSITALIKSIVL